MTIKFGHSANFIVRIFFCHLVRTRSTTTRDRNLQFQGAVSDWRLSTGFFGFFSSIYVQFSKTSPLKSGESSEKSSGENRVKSCHVCGCHGFFGPDLDTLRILLSELSFVIYFCIAQIVRCHSENGISHPENHSLNPESCCKSTLELSESSENGLPAPRACH